MKKETIKEKRKKAGHEASDGVLEENVEREGLKWSRDYRGIDPVAAAYKIRQPGQVL